MPVLKSSAFSGLENVVFASMNKTFAFSDDAFAHFHTFAQALVGGGMFDPITFLGRERKRHTRFGEVGRIHLNESSTSFSYNLTDSAMIGFSGMPSMRFS